MGNINASPPSSVGTPSPLTTRDKETPLGTDDESSEIIPLELGRYAIDENTRDGVSTIPDCHPIHALPPSSLMTRQSIALLEDAELECAFLPQLTLLEYCSCSVPGKQDASIMATLKRACACTVNDKISPRGEEEWNSGDINSNTIDDRGYSNRYTSYDGTILNDNSRSSYDKRITTSTDLYSYNAGKGTASFTTRDTQASPSPDPYQSAINQYSTSSVSYGGSPDEGASRSTAQFESTWVAGNRKLGNPPILIYDNMT